MTTLRSPVVAALTVATLFLLPDVLHGQTSLGLHGGLTFASLEGEDVGEGLDTNQGFMAGANLTFPIGGVIALSPGAWYVQKGSQAEEGNEKVEFDLSYLEVPILAVVSLSGGEGALGFNVFLGPSVAIEIGCGITGSSGDDEVTTDCDEEGDEEERRKVDFGAIFGAGLSFPLSERLHILVNGGLDMGLRSLDTSSEENDVKNSMWFATAGVSLPLGG